MRRSILLAFAAIALIATTEPADAKKFKLWSSGSKKADTEDSHWAGDAVSGAIDLGSAALDAASDDASDPAPEDRDVLRTERLDLGAGMHATREFYRYGGRVEVVGASGGKIVTFFRRTNPPPLDRVAARLLNVRKLPVEKIVPVDELIRSGALHDASDHEIEAWEFSSRLDPAVAALEKRKIRRDGVRLLALRKRTGDRILLRPDSRGKIGIVVPRGFRIEDAPQGAEAYYVTPRGECLGTASGCLPLAEPVAEKQDLATCFGNLPDNLKVHAFGAYEGSGKPALRIGKAKRSKTRQIDIYLGASDRPVALALGAYRATVWAIHQGKGSKLAAIHVRGHHPQAVSGVPAEIPIRFATRKEGTQSGCGSATRSYKNDEKAAVWARESAEIFGQPFASFEGQYRAKTFATGRWRGLDEAPPLPLDIATIRASAPVREPDFDLPTGPILILGFFLFTFRRRIARLF